MVATDEPPPAADESARQKELIGSLTRHYGIHREAGAVVEAMGKLLGERHDSTVREKMRHVYAADKALDALTSSMIPVLPITEEAAELSVIIHTFLRKCADTPSSWLLRRWIDRSRGRRAWTAFVSQIQEERNDLTDRSVELALLDAEEAASDASLLRAIITWGS